MFTLKHLNNFHKLFKVIISKEIFLFLQFKSDNIEVLWHYICSCISKQICHGNDYKTNIE